MRGKKYRGKAASSSCSFPTTTEVPMSMMPLAQVAPNPAPRFIVDSPQAETAPSIEPAEVPTSVMPLASAAPNPSPSIAPGRVRPYYDATTASTATATTAGNDPCFVAATSSFSFPRGSRGPYDYDAASSSSQSSSKIYHGYSASASCTFHGS